MTAGNILFWAAVGLLALVAGAAMLRPLLRGARRSSGDDGAEDLAFFSSQIEELNRDLERGLISREQHAQAEAEIGRRILAFEQGGAKQKGASGRSPWLAGALGAAVPALAIALYLMVGAPGVPSQPFETRSDMAGREYRTLLDLAATLEERLAEHPDDIDTWIALAEARSRLEQHDRAQEAWRRAVLLAEGDPPLAANLLGAFAESIILAGDGGVSDRALTAIEEALRLNPREPRARYYKGLALMERGDSEGALSAWRALAADSPPDAPWLPTVRMRIAEIEGGAPPRASARGPAISDEAMAEMMDLSEEEQTARIEGMVEGLRARLEAEPDDRAGWLRLANAYGVMGRQADALDALSNAASRAGMDASAQDEVLRAYFAIVPEAMAPDGERDGAIPQPAVTLASQLYAIDQEHRPALWVLASAARASGEYAAARGFLKLLLEQLPEGQPERQEIQRQLDELDDPARLSD